MPLREPTSIFRLELALLGFFLACWIVFFVVALAGYPFAGTLQLDLYQLYGIAALVGWVLGNVFVQRSKRWEQKSRRRLVLVFLLSPGGLFYLLWALGSSAARTSVPFAPLYAFVVAAVLFLVPVSFRSSFAARRDR